MGQSVCLWQWSSSRWIQAGWNLLWCPLCWWFRCAMWWSRQHHQYLWSWWSCWDYFNYWIHNRVYLGANCINNRGCCNCFPNDYVYGIKIKTFPQMISIWELLNLINEWFPLTVSLIQPSTDNSTCESLATPVLSKCQGCPPMYNGKPCASTTRYNDLTKGSCGCGDDPNPTTFWTKTSYTAAGNAMMMDDVDPTNSWCVTNCGLCFEVCTTGGSHTGASHTPDECITIQIENRY